MNDKAQIQRAVRRTVGIAALRRLRRIVDEQTALDADNGRRARRLSAFFVVAAVLALAWIAIR